MMKNDYQHLALRSWVQINDRDDMRHAVLGLVSEVGEIADVMKKQLAYGKPLDMVNLAEECADAFWYMALACEKKGLLFSGLTFEVDDKTGLYDMTQAVAGLVGTMALGAVDDEAPIEAWKQAFDTLSDGLASILHHTGISLDEALTRNIRKLQVRYPEKFDAERALNRDLDAERAVLEGR